MAAPTVAGDTVDVAVKRWQNYTGKSAVLVATGQTFEDASEDDLAAKFSNDDCRAVMQSDWYKRTFPHAQIDRAKNTETEFRTTTCGYRLATSVGGTLTGRGGEVELATAAVAWERRGRRLAFRTVCRTGSWRAH